MIINADIFTIYESLLQNVINILPTIYQNKTKVPEKNEQVPGLTTRKERR